MYNRGDVLAPAWPVGNFPADPGQCLSGKVGGILPEVVHPFSLWKLTLGARVTESVLSIDDGEVVGGGGRCGPYLVFSWQLTALESPYPQPPGPHNGRFLFFHHWIKGLHLLFKFTFYLFLLLTWPVYLVFARKHTKSKNNKAFLSSK